MREEWRNVSPFYFSLLSHASGGHLEVPVWPPGVLLSMETTALPIASLLHYGCSQNLRLCLTLPWRSSYPRNENKRTTGRHMQSCVNKKYHRQRTFTGRNLFLDHLILKKVRVTLVFRFTRMGLGHIFSLHMLHFYIYKKFKKPVEIQRALIPFLSQCLAMFLPLHRSYLCTPPRFVPIPSTSH
jgi:hypothetical protein